MRLILIAVLMTVVFAGCSQQNEPAGQSTIQASNPLASDSVSDVHGSAFEFDESGSRILLDTQNPPGQKRVFGIGLGSITIETKSIRDGILTFLYTPEVEGGYVVYECQIPISAEPVVFEIDASGCPGKTSFDLARCKVVRSGNLHFDSE